MNKDIKLFSFSDSSWVIIGDHVSKEDAQKLATEEDPCLIVESVQHCWVRYEFIADGESIFDDFEPSERPRWWVLHESQSRPKGVVRKATVIIPV